MTAAGMDVAAARATVPLQQARALWNIALRYKSYKALHWMFFIRCTGPAVLAGRIPQLSQLRRSLTVRRCVRSGLRRRDAAARHKALRTVSADTILSDRKLGTRRRGWTSKASRAVPHVNVRGMRR